MRAWGVLVAGLAAAVALSGGASSEPARPSTRPVAIEVASGDHAAGFVVARARVVTVAHVVENGGRLRVQANGQRAKRARVLRLDRRADLALLAVPGLSAGRRARIAAPAGAGSALRLLPPGQASTRRATVRRAIDLHLRRASGGRVRRRSGLELDASVARGDSGAALVTTRGEVAGVVFARSRNGPNTAYAVDATELRRFLR